MDIASPSGAYWDEFQVFIETNTKLACTQGDSLYAVSYYEPTNKETNPEIANASRIPEAIVSNLLLFWDHAIIT